MVSSPVFFRPNKEGGKKLTKAEIKAVVDELNRITNKGILSTKFAVEEDYIVGRINDIEPNAEKKALVIQKKFNQSLFKPSKSILTIDYLGTNADEPDIKSSHDSSLLELHKQREFTALVEKYFKGKNPEVSFNDEGGRTHINIILNHNQKGTSRTKKASTRKTPMKQNKASPKKGPKVVYELTLEDVRGNTTDYELNKYDKYVRSELGKVLDSKVAYDIEFLEIFPPKYILTIYKGKKTVNQINDLITEFHNNVDGTDRFRFPLDIVGTGTNSDYWNGAE